jgi:hypothetical protein
MDMSVFIVQRKYGPYRALFEYLSAKNKTPEQEEYRLKQLVQLAAMRSDSDRAQMYTASQKSTSSYRKSSNEATKRLYKQADALGKRIEGMKDTRATEVTRIARRMEEDYEKKRLKAQQSKEDRDKAVQENKNAQTSFMEKQHSYYASSEFIKKLAREIYADDKLKTFIGVDVNSAEAAASAITSGTELMEFFKNAQTANKPLTDTEKLNLLESFIRSATGTPEDTNGLRYNGTNELLGEEKHYFQNPNITTKSLAKAMAYEYGIVGEGVKKGAIKKAITQPELATNINKIEAAGKDLSFSMPKKSSEYWYNESLKRVPEIDKRIKELEGQQKDLKPSAVSTEPAKDEAELDEALSELQAFYQYGSRPMVGRQPYLAPVVLEGMKRFAVKTVPKVDKRLGQVGEGLTTAGEKITDTLQDAADEDILGLLADSFDDAVDTVKANRAKQKAEEEKTPPPTKEQKDEVEFVTDPRKSRITDDNPWGIPTEEEKTAPPKEEEKVSKKKEKKVKKRTTDTPTDEIEETETGLVVTAPDGVRWKLDFITNSIFPKDISGHPDDAEIISFKKAFGPGGFLRQVYKDNQSFLDNFGDKFRATPEAKKAIEALDKTEAKKAIKKLKKTGPEENETLSPEEENFVPHMMYKDGEKKIAATHEEHIRLGEAGWSHDKPETEDASYPWGTDAEGYKEEDTVYMADVTDRSVYPQLTGQEKEKVTQFINKYFPESQQSYDVETPLLTPEETEKKKDIVTKELEKKDISEQGKQIAKIMADGFKEYEITDEIGRDKKMYIKAVVDQNTEKIIRYEVWRGQDRFSSFNLVDHKDIYDQLHKAVTGTPIKSEYMEKPERK